MMRTIFETFKFETFMERCLQNDLFYYLTDLSSHPVRTNGKRSKFRVGNRFSYRTRNRVKYRIKNRVRNRVRHRVRYRVRNQDSNRENRNFSRKAYN